MFLKNNEIYTKTRHAGNPLSSLKLKNKRKNGENMQSSISSYSSRLIEGLGSFASLTTFFLAVSEKQKHSKGHAKRAHALLL